MTSTPRRLLLLSPHFPPDSSAGTHRARVIAPHLHTFGWKPVVLTVDPASVDGELDPELASACDERLQVVRVPAWQAARTRQFGFGDLGLRAYAPLRRAAVGHLQSVGADAILVTTYPIYPALIGPALKRRARIPFVLDLQDPWVGAWGRSVGPGGAPDLRSRASRTLATLLERHVAPVADGLMSVTARTIEEVVERVPAAGHTPRLELPIGWEPADWARVRRRADTNGLFDPHDGHIHVCAVGTLLPTAIDGVHAALNGIARVAVDPEVRRRLRVWFVGTSNQRHAEAPAVVRPLAARYGVGDIVVEHPPRVSYFDALRLLRDARAVLVLGSDEPHYTPSRVFPAIASRHPIIARLHRASPAWRLVQGARTSRPVHLIDALPAGEQPAQAFANAFTRIVQTADSPSAHDDALLAPFTGEALARRVAAFLDQVAR